MKHHHYCCLMAKEQMYILKSSSRWWMAGIASFGRFIVLRNFLSTLVCIRSIVVGLRPRTIIIRFVNFCKPRLPLLEIVIFFAFPDENVCMLWRNWNCFRYNKFLFESSGKLFNLKAEKKILSSPFFTPLHSNFLCLLLFIFRLYVCTLMYGFVSTTIIDFCLCFVYLSVEATSGLSEWNWQKYPRNVIQIQLLLKILRSKGKLFPFSLSSWEDIQTKRKHWEQKQPSDSL